ncbi:MAG: SDR family oxidoreductase [Candidatus Aceula lacicola]|nr:SDR family oxidoreductase [Candidatus Aceula lacicola]
MAIDKENIFLTGSTGFLGSNLLKLFLLEELIDTVYLLVRPSKQESSFSRIDKVLLKILEGKECRRNKIVVISGDISMSKFGLESSLYNDLCEKINRVYHSAALTGFGIDLKMAQKVNVVGTQNVIDFCLECKNLRKFNYVGTTFIAGDKEGEFSEDDFDCGQKFNNYYEQSKFEAEALVRGVFSDKSFSTLIFRPSIILGGFEKGETSNFKMFYEPVYLFSKKILKVVPADVDCLHNIVPVDVVAQAIFLLGQTEEGSAVYHIVNPENVKSGHFVDIAARFFGYLNPEFIPLRKFNFKDLTPVQHRLIEPFMPYFNYKSFFVSDKTQKVLKNYGFKYPDINDEFYLRLFQYCCKVGFIKKVK